MKLKRQKSPLEWEEEKPHTKKEIKQRHNNTTKVKFNLRLDFVLYQSSSAIHTFERWIEYKMCEKKRDFLLFLTTRLSWSPLFNLLTVLHEWLRLSRAHWHRAHIENAHQCRRFCSRQSCRYISCCCCCYYGSVGWWWSSKERKKVEFFWVLRGRVGRRELKVKSSSSAERQSERLAEVLQLTRL